MSHMLGDGGFLPHAGAPGEQSGRLAELFGLLSDSSKAGILYALLEAGELSADALTAWTGLPPHRAADDLRALRSARVVNSRREGDGVLYHLQGDDIRRLLEVAGRQIGPRRPWQARSVAGAR